VEDFRVVHFERHKHKQVVLRKERTKEGRVG
jgi:hypothetical protein